jgi:hypothetical protein
MAAGMDRRNRYVQTLAQAVEALGGRERLAVFLGVPQEQLAAWLAGEEAPPREAILCSLDAIADG